MKGAPQGRLRPRGPSKLQNVPLALGSIFTLSPDPPPEPQSPSRPLPFSKLAGKRSPVTWPETLKPLSSRTLLKSYRQPEHRMVGKAHLGGLPAGGGT